MSENHSQAYYDGQYHYDPAGNSDYNVDQYYGQPYDDYGELYNGFVLVISIHKKHNLMNLTGLVKGRPT
jgi:hypothetical protein